MTMKLEGIHHVSSITADAQANVDYYAGVLGLRMVKKTVNQDDPTVYHLFYGDEHGSPGMDLTFFEYPGALPGRAGNGMIHRIVLRVGSQEALDFWADRLGLEGAEGALVFEDPEGLGLELRVVETTDAPLTAEHPEIPQEFAIQGFEEVRAYTNDPERSRAFLEGALQFAPDGESSWEVRGEQRGGRYVYDQAPAETGIPGAGTVHHVAWGTRDEAHELELRQRVLEGGAHPTPLIDRFWFKSVYFREPSGVLFELATAGPGFAADEDPAHLGESLVLPPAFEHMRERIERTVKPIVNPRQSVTR
jgi:glyoxalase family protein